MPDQAAWDLHTSIPLTPTQSLRRAPDIDDLARRAGLPLSISPYRLEAFNGQLFIEAAGNGTPTVNTFILFGFSKDLHVARAFVRQFPERSDPVLLREKFRNLAWLPDQWLQNAVIEARDATDEEQRAEELFRLLLEEVPELRQWMPWALDERPNLVKKGEIADKLQEELQKINEACRPKKKATYELRNQFPELSLWQAVEELSPKQASLFDGRFEPRGTWSAEEIRDCIASIMSTGSGHTVKRWIMLYRKWKRTILKV